MAKVGISRRNGPRRRQRRANPDIRPGVGTAERCSQKGHEFLNVTVVPTTSTLGQTLFQLEVNPTQVPRLAIIASQYKQWRGRMSMTVESLGNAFSTSSVALAFIPDPDPNELPSVPTDLLRVVESAPSRADLHLQAVGTKTVTANWDLSTNPWKFVQDTDVSDRANGLFLLVSYGSPGTTPVNLRIGVSYDITFQGNTYSPASEVTPLSALDVLARVNQIILGTPCNTTVVGLAVNVTGALPFPPALQGTWPLITEVNYGTIDDTSTADLNVGAITTFVVAPNLASFTYVATPTVADATGVFAFVAPRT